MMTKFVTVLTLMMSSTAMFAFADDQRQVAMKVRVCRSQYSTRCAELSALRGQDVSEVESFVDCEQDENQVAASICEIHNLDGSVESRPFGIVPISKKKGNRCNISIFDVMCLK